MNHYYKQKSCEETSHYSFLEVDQQGEVLRVVDVRPDSSEFPIVSSNVELIFPEGDIDWGELVDDPENPFPVTRIDLNEFETQWHKNIERNLERWEGIKCKYPVTSKICGGIVQYASPIVLVEIEPLVYGRIPMQTVLEGIREFPPGPTHFKVDGVVAGYDETNQWLEMDIVSFSPELFPIRPRPQFTE